MRNINTSRELHVGQKVIVLIEAEVIQVPDPMDYSDTVTVRDINNQLLFAQVQARNVHPLS